MVNKLSFIWRNLADYSSNDLDLVFVNGRIYKTCMNAKALYIIGLAFGNEKTRATKSLAKTALDARQSYAKNSSLPILSQWAILKNLPQVKLPTPRGLPAGKSSLRSEWGIFRRNKNHPLSPTTTHLHLT